MIDLERLSFNELINLSDKIQQKITKFNQNRKQTFQDKLDSFPESTDLKRRGTALRNEWDEYFIGKDIVVKRLIDIQVGSMTFNNLGELRVDYHCSGEFYEIDDNFPDDLKELISATQDLIKEVRAFVERNNLNFVPVAEEFNMYFVYPLYDEPNSINA